MSDENRAIDPVVEQLRQERIDRRVKSKDLAESIGLNPSTLSSYESGTVSPQLSVIRDWAYALDHEPTLNRIGKTSPRSRMKSDIPADLATVHLSRYQIALAMGMLYSPMMSSRDDQPKMSADLQVIINILARALA